MARVVLIATLPSLRLGLSSMLADPGHQVVPEEAAEEDAVWVVDAPDASAVDRFFSRRAALPSRPLVVLSDDPGVAARLAAANLPGWACLPRDSGPADLDLAVRAAEAGLVLLDLPIAAAVIAPPPARPADDLGEPLTPRELQVLQLIAQGLPNKGIARSLGISENTAKFHVASLTTKLGAASRTEAVTRGARRGLIVL